MKKLSRRKFLIHSAQGAAGLSILAGCDSRKSTGPDIRPPSKPTGLSVYVEFRADGTKVALLSWHPHNLTDNTGSPSEVRIRGFNIYRDDLLLNTTIINATSYEDYKNLQDGLTYNYQITAVDDNDNESERSTAFIAEVKHPSIIYVMTRNDVFANNNINAEVVKTMVHAGVKSLTGKNDIAAAYESLFPTLSATVKIGIKINLLAKTGLQTHPEVVNAIIDGLKRMLGGAFPLNNIIVFDDRMPSHFISAGFKLKNNPDDYQVVSTYGETDSSGNPNWGNQVLIAGSKQRFSRIAERVDYIINVPVLKDHNCAGITFALKNFFGLIDKPGDMHNNPAITKKSWCDPYIAAVYKKVASKVRLIVGDAIFGVSNGGPDGDTDFQPNSIFISTDPVAIDMHALKVINDKRGKTGRYLIATAIDDLYPSRADARHIITSNLKEYALGIINNKIVEVKT